MSSHPSGGICAPRLNPFAFPSDTSFRFALLIVFVVCGSLLMYGELWSVFSGDRHLEEALPKQLFEWFRNLRIFDLSSPPNFPDLAQKLQPLYRSVVPWQISGGVLTLTLATVIYWFMPAWKIRRNRLQLLHPQDQADVTAYLEHLCREVGLSRVPTFLWNPLELISGAIAFGRLGKYYVSLTGGLVVTFYTDRPAFRAVVLHELAHLRNDDVNMTCFTVALWWAFVVTAILPSVAGLLWPSARWDTIYTMIWVGAVSTALVWLAGIAVLRTREFYADVRASVWDGPSGGLRRVLEALPSVRGSRWPGMSFHPDPDERRQMLEDTYRLLRLGFWDAFGAGLAAVIIIDSVRYLWMGLFFTPDLTRHPVYLWSFAAMFVFGLPLFFISLSVGAVGIGVWRGAFAALVRGQAPHEAGRLGFALALGILGGELLLAVPILFVVSGSATPDQSSAAGSILLLGSLTALGLTVLFSAVFLIFKWLAAAASAWLEVVLRRRSPRRPLIISLVIASGSMAVWASGIILLMWGLIVYVILHAQPPSEPPGPLRMFDYLIIYPGFAIYATSISFWLFPLAAWLWRERVASEAQSPWAFLEGESARVALPAQAPIRVKLALTIGLAVGLLSCTVFLLLRIPAFRGLFVPMDELTLLLVFSSLFASAQASAAAIAAAWIGRLGALHGLCSASIAGYVITVGWMLFVAADYADYIGVIFLLGTGTLLALPVALGVSALADWIRRKARFK